jgi:inhibitor of cysteine peptidase
MKMTLAVFGIAFAVALAASPSRATDLPPHSPVFIARDAARPISVAAGEEFFVALDSNVTTGYSWTAAIGDGTVASTEGSVYQPPASQAMGAGGQQIFIFRAGRAGTTGIVFTYAKTAAKTLTFDVTVH